MKNIFLKTLKFISSRLTYLVVGIFLAIGATYVYAAWTAPASAPPEGNMAAPINTSNTGQAKQGGLIINTGGSANGLIVQYGNVGIGTLSPGAKLDVAGQVKITGGSPGAGKVLTSDASGLASWQTSAGGIGGNGMANYVPKWTAATTLGNSQIFDNGTNVGIGTISPQAKLDVNGNIIAAAPTASNHLATKNYVDSAVAAAGGGGSPGSWTCEFRRQSGAGGANAICPNSSYKLITGGCSIYYSGSTGTYTKANLTYDNPYLFDNIMGWACICGRRDSSCSLTAYAYCCK